MSNLKTKSSIRSDDVEQSALEHSKEAQEGIIEEYVASRSLATSLKVLATAGVELRGLEPVAPEDRTHKRYLNILTLFGGSFISILPYVHTQSI